MIKGILMKALKSLTPEEKQSFREALETEEKGEEKVVENKEEEKREEETEKTDENGEEKTEEKEVTTEKVEDKEETEDSSENKEDSSEEKEEIEETTEEEQGTVEQAEEQGNGIRIEDLVTMDMLTERLAATEAKIEAVLKENSDLKNELSEMKDKYENKDFGMLKRTGVMTKDKNANETFAEYAKQFS